MCSLLRCQKVVHCPIQKCFIVSEINFCCKIIIKNLLTGYDNLIAALSSILKAYYQVTVGEGFPFALHSNVTVVSFLTTTLPLDGSGITLGGTSKKRRKIAFIPINNEFFLITIIVNNILILCLLFVKLKNCHTWKLIKFD